MSKIHDDGLFLLIQSMTASEKRYFKMNAVHNSSKHDANFLKLFDYLSSVQYYSEDHLQQQHICEPKQMSNLKAHLYQKLLNSLRQIPSQQTIDIVLRDELNNAVVLYNKGLYQQSLKILNKAKKKAQLYDEHALHFEINKLEKIIESQYITRSEKNRAIELIEDSNTLIQRTIRENDLMNLTLWLYNYLLKVGYANTDSKKAAIRAKVALVLDEMNLNQLAFNEKLWWFKVKVWENLVVSRSMVAEASKDWVEHFYDNKDMIFMHPVWFIKGNHYLLQALFHNYNKTSFDFYFDKFYKVIENDNFPINPNVRNLIFIYKNTASLNRDFLHTNYLNIHEWTFIFNETKKFEQVIDRHYLNIIKFKIGALFFINRSFEPSQLALEAIENPKYDNQKNDLYFYSQILLLMNYYDSGDDENVEQVLQNLSSMVQKKKWYGEFHNQLVVMFEEIFTASPLDIRSTLQKNFEMLINFKNNTDYQRSLSFLSLNIWLKSHLNNESLQGLMKTSVLKKLK